MRRTFAALILAFLAPLLSAQVVIDATGRTVSAPPFLPAGTSTVIEIVGGGAHQVRYRMHDTLPEQPVALTDDDLTATADGNRYTIPGKAADGSSPAFITYNVWQVVRDVELTEDEKRAKELERDQLRKDLAVAKNAPEVKELLRLTRPDEQPPTADELEKARLTAQIQVLEKEETAYTHVAAEATITPLAKLEPELRVLRQQLVEVEARLAAEQRQRPTRIKELEAHAAVKLVKDLTGKLAAAEAALSPREFNALKLGILIRGEHRKQALFSFPPYRQDDAIRLQLVGDLPVLTEEDALYLILANRQRTKHPTAFTLTVKADKGTPIEEAKVRPPSAGPALERGAGAAATINVTDATYDDVVLSIGKRFNGNDIPKLTLTATVLATTEDKTITTDGKTTVSKTVQRQEATLLNEFVLPQVHPLYRFNVTTGVLYSTIEDRDFVKVQTQLDNPATTENEARYRIDELRKGRDVRPAVGITWYWHPIDPLAPLGTRARLTPQPTIAFGINQPAKNIFLGFSNEIARSLQVLWGWHRGEITELKPRTDVDEDRQSALPPTRTKPENGIFVGVSFNINTLTKLFGGG